MDARNWFETKTTMLLHRLEWLVGLVACSVLLLMHLPEVRWGVFVVLFVVIDLIGYIPGAIAHHRSSTKLIAKGYYVAYNVMHSLVTASVIAGLWALLVRPEWALLALPIHLLGDRALFGNSLKPFGISFEPKTHPAFASFRLAYQSGGADRSRDLEVSRDVRDVVTA